jgi:hypothetical protein
MLRIGFGKADITPPLGTLCALGLDDEAEAILDPVFIRATVLKEVETAFGILSADVIGFCRKEVDELREILSAATGLRAEQIVIHATHTHESPSVRTGWTEVTRPWELNWHNAEFYERIVGQAVDAFRQAMENTYEATLSFGRSPVAGVASNRRIVLSDGRLVLRGSRASAEHRLYPEGWIDPFTRLVVFQDLGSEREHWLISYCCHPTSAGGDEGPYITADFPGEAMSRIERARPHVTTNYVTGCCGNINPGKYTGSSNAPGERKADVIRMGGLMAEAALRARDVASGVDSDRIAWAQKPVQLPLIDKVLDPAVVETELAAHARAYLEMRDAGGKVPGGGPLRRATNRAMVNRQAIDGHLSTEVAALGLGDLGIVFLPGECFLELDAALRQRFPGKQIVTAENCDYTTGYIVPRPAYQRGGYEARAAVCRPVSHDLLIDAASRALRAIWAS